MQAISAKLNSVSFVRKCNGTRQPMIHPENWKLIKWIFPCGALMAACLSHIYKVSKKNVISINSVLGIEKYENILKKLLFLS